MQTSNRVATFVWLRAARVLEVTGRSICEHAVDKNAQRIVDQK